MFASEVRTPSKRSRVDSDEVQEDGPRKKLRYPKFFMKNIRNEWRCILCTDQHYGPYSKALRHEESDRHVKALRGADRDSGRPASPPSSPPIIPDERTNMGSRIAGSALNGQAAGVEEESQVRGSRAESWMPASDDELEGTPSQRDQPVHLGYDSGDDEGYSLGTIHGPALPDDDPEQIYDDFGGDLALIDEEYDGEKTTYYDTLPEVLEFANVMGWARDGEVPEDDDEDLGDDDEDEDEDGELEHARSPQQSPFSSAAGTAVLEGTPIGPELLLGQESVAGETSIIADLPDAAHLVQDHLEEGYWWPWPSREACLLDIMGAFPRALFSESELGAARWLASKLGARKLPTIRQVKLAREAVQRVAGLAPRTHESEHGNLYTVEDMEQIIRHEFANPIVRDGLELYAQASATPLQDTRQAEKWLHEVDPNLAGPMARSSSGKDFFVNELAMATVTSEAGSTVNPVMIRRWYQRGKTLVAKVSPVRLTREREEFVVDDRPGVNFEVPLGAFLLSVSDMHLQEVQETYGLPSPDCIKGVLRSHNADMPLEKWEHPTRNEWRIRAAGKAVYALPIWLYCDDTSGNTSKKWNKHNSVLFVLGGLPHDQVQRLYNIHFLSTSNIAGPLEMMERVSAVLRSARKDGIEVWDCLTGEDALVIPWVHAFQGDNPMASEFASHVGMTGKCICRICEVYRKVEGERPPPPGSSVAESQRLHAFLTPGKPRTKETTLKDLRAQEDRAFGGAPSAIEGMGTNTGTRDKYLQYFIDKLQASLNQWRIEQRRRTEGGEENPNTEQTPELQEHRAPSATCRPDGRDSDEPSAPVSWEERLASRLRELRAEMPRNIYNPVLEIPDFDAHKDSPLEILHVVLLGVAKYFWRDACSRQTPEGKAILKTRLTSMSVDGLGISPIRGHTLVYYAKSLVGRDFRVIIQVAPAVLHGMVPDEAYEAWLALGRLAPLIFQNTIEDLAKYKDKLQAAINDFLGATALWTTQWFNKPKFHLFVHLMDHILRFGPAALYSTEAFESYNFVIRLRSINSNKHAPSKDIAHAFSHLHAVRHLISGGYVTVDEQGLPTPPRQAGEGVRRLIDDKELRVLMCMNHLQNDHRAGEYMPMSAKDGAHCLRTDTATYRAGLSDVLPSKVTRCKYVYLQNEDRASIGSHVVYVNSGDNDRIPCVGRVQEILSDPETNAFLGLLVSECFIGDLISPYRMPSCRLAKPEIYSWLCIENLQAAVNTFHNCYNNHCKLTKTRALRQERRLVAKKEDEVTHSGDTEDLVLNTAQLRSAQCLLAFRTDGARYPGPDLTQEELVDRAMKVRAQLDLEAARKKLEAQQKQTARTTRRKAKQRNPASPSSPSPVVNPAMPLPYSPGSPSPHTGASQIRSRQHPGPHVTPPHENMQPSTLHLRPAGSETLLAPSQQMRDPRYYPSWTPSPSSAGRSHGLGASSVLPMQNVTTAVASPRLALPPEWPSQPRLSVFPSTPPRPSDSLPSTYTLPSLQAAGFYSPNIQNNPGVLPTSVREDPATPGSPFEDPEFQAAWQEYT